MSTKCGCGPAMTGGVATGSYAKCAGFPVYLTDVEGVTGAWAVHYTQQVGSPTGKDDSSNCSVFWFVVNCILCHRLPYFKSTPGDCPKESNVDISGAGITKVLGVGGAVSGLAAGGIGIATGVSGSAALAEGGLAALGASLGIASFGIGLLAIPFAILAHHSAAVALEQEVLCAVSSAYNQYADQVEAALRSGQISVQQASLVADQIKDQIQKTLQQGMKSCNARCYYNYAIQALTLFCKERLFPSLVPSANTAQPQNSLACAEAYWNLYPDVASNSAMGRNGTMGAAGAWWHYTNAGQKEGRTWPCNSTQGVAPQSATTVAGIAAAGLALATGHPFLAAIGAAFAFKR